MNCNIQTFLFKINIQILRFKLDHCNFLPQTELSTLSPGTNWLISTAWVEFDGGVEEQTLVQSGQCDGLSCSGLNERPCPSGWNRGWSSGLSWRKSPLICGASDKVFWGMLEIGYHKREVYYTTGASTTAGPKSILSHMSESHCIR